MSHTSAKDRTMLVYREGHTDRMAFFKAKLVVLEGPEPGAEFIIDRDVIRVGSSKNNELVIAEKTVSRNHFEIRVEESGYFIKDLGSTNGTDVDGCRIREAFLHPDAQIGMGDVVLVFRPMQERVEVPLSSHNNFGGMLGSSMKMRALFHMAQRIAARNTIVLITGETGTGKGLLAEELHKHSERKGKPFVVVDCSTIPDHLMETELFGHVKGAFTGAVSSRQGSFEAADGGTIFFDEIGELPAQLQPKLLRVLEKQEIKRVGENRTFPVDTRIIAATNRDLRSEVEANRFREDLYFRLSVFELKIPALKERKEDIPFLAKEMLRTIGKDHKRKFGDDALRFLQNHDWPGNVRELRNVVERVLHLTDEPLIDLPSLMSTSMAQMRPAGDSGQGPSRGHLSFQDARELAEQEYLVDLLKSHDGNVSQASKTAGIHRQSLHRLLRKHDIKSSEID